MLAAAAAGADLQDLAGLAEEMRARTAPPDSDGGDDGSGRSLRLDLHYRGAGRLRGDLTPRCAAALQVVLEALGKKAGREDTRSRPQRDHDALEEACRRLIAAGNLPQRAGQPTQISLHMTLDDLINGPSNGTSAGWGSGGTAGSGGSAGWGGGGTGGSGGSGPAPSSWLLPDRGDMNRGNMNRGDMNRDDMNRGDVERGDIVPRRLFPTGDDLAREQRGGWTGPGAMASPGDLCDASIVPVVSGHVDHELLDKLANSLLAHIANPAAPREPADSDLENSDAAEDSTGARLAVDFARDLILRNAVALLSGPAGLASRLRTGFLAGPAASISLPLDVGTATDTIPPHLRRAVILRDQHCGFPGCTMTNCQVHHVIPLSEGGATCLENLTLACTFHHLIAVHSWGWKLILNADGTKTAISPYGRRVVRSHDPPSACAA